jgi:plasmid replication initiation protein
MNVQLQHQISNYISVNSNRSVFSAVQTNSNAVYGTRLLHGMWHWGIHYDDLEICNGQGVFKNGISKLQEQLNMLKNYKKYEQVKKK